MSSLAVGSNLKTDALSCLKVGGSQTYFSSRELYNRKNPRYLETTTGVGATATANAEGYVSLIASTFANTQKVVRQTNEYMYYKSGLFRLINMGVVLNTNPIASSGIRCRAGYFDSNLDKTVDDSGDGYFFELDGNVLNVVERNSTSAETNEALEFASDTRVAQARWNLDILDGSGSSGKTLASTAYDDVLNLVIGFKYFGIGKVKMGIILDGDVVWVHEFTHSGATAPSIKQSSLPIRYEVSKTIGNANAGEMRMISTSVQDESMDFGFTYEKGVLSRSLFPYVIRGVSRGQTVMTTFNNDANVPVISLRLSAGNERRRIKILNIMVHARNTADSRLGVFTNGTLTAPTWTAADSSIVEFDISEPLANPITGGFNHWWGFIEDTQYFNYKLDQLKDIPIISSDIAGNVESLHFIINTDAAAIQLMASIVWAEW